MRLSNSTLDRLPAGLKPPAYPRKDCGIGIVHLGIGAFHRCHMAMYTDVVLAQKTGDWRILGVSLRSPAIRDQLNPQDGLYTVTVTDDSSTHTCVVGSIAGVLFAPDTSGTVIDALAAPTTRIISLTITEKGYCHDPASGRLNESHPDIIHDLAHPEAPRSAMGYLVAGLLERQKTGAGPVTILSCDNLPANGKTVARIVRRMAQLVSPDLSAWIDTNVTFPSSMVDRIVPAMKPEDVEAFASKTGLTDAATLQTEPFTQWVIEDQFAAGRPEWENAGATLVEDVEPYEETKLRMLNGSHSALAYLGYLAGCKYVHEVMAIPEMCDYADIFMRTEAATSLKLPDGLDIDAYREGLKKRYKNSALQHRTWQIAMDGSQKIPQRLLGTLRHQLETKGPISACSLALAAWMRYVMAVDEQGRDINVQDPLADHLKSLADEAGHDAVAVVLAMLDVKEIFGKDLRSQQSLRLELTKWLQRLLNEGALNTVRYFTECYKSEDSHEQRNHQDLAMQSLGASGPVR